LGLCAPGVILDEGNPVQLNHGQEILWQWWLEFWNNWVTKATKGERFNVIVNGDIVDGTPYGSVAQISSNPADQERIVLAAFEPVLKLLKKVGGKLYVVRGTEAHGGKSCADEERAAYALQAMKDDNGHYAHWSIWMKVGYGLVSCMHHIGTTSSSQHEASAVNAEIAAEYNEAAKAGLEPPDIIVRSHRHRWIEVRVPTTHKLPHVQFATAVVTPAWQLKTPFAWRTPGGRVSPPQIGGILIRQGDWELHTRVWLRTIGRPKIIT